MRHRQAGRGPGCLMCLSLVIAPGETPSRLLACDWNYRRGASRPPPRTNLNFKLKATVTVTVTGTSAPLVQHCLGGRRCVGLRAQTLRFSRGRALVNLFRFLENFKFFTGST